MVETPLKIIMDAYDRAGVHYVVRQNERGVHYLVKCGHHKKEELKAIPFDQFIRDEFMEFWQDGSIASY
jgi:hypothetical protein